MSFMKQTKKKIKFYLRLNPWKQITVEYDNWGKPEVFNMLEVVALNEIFD